MRIFPFVLAAVASASPLTPKPQAVHPVYWLLAGDSTTAATTASGGGWGNGFLSTTVAPGSSGHNYGHNGATTASFRAGGDWSNVTADIMKYKSQYSVYVTIQFGHNDQKESSGVTLDEYKANLLRFAREAKDMGATPVLVTPLTRRVFKNGKVVESLANQRTATLGVAQNNSIQAIDLNMASEKYCNAIGEANAHKYNLNSNDTTHLNAWGSVVFGRMVSDLLVQAIPSLDDVTKANATLTGLIAAGKPA